MFRSWFINLFESFFGNIFNTCVFFWCFIFLLNCWLNLLGFSSRSNWSCWWGFFSFCWSSFFYSWCGFYFSFFCFSWFLLFLCKSFLWTICIWVGFFFIIWLFFFFIFCFAFLINISQFFSFTWFKCDTSSCWKSILNSFSWSNSFCRVNFIKSIFCHAFSFIINTFIITSSCCISSNCSCGRCCMKFLIMINLV